MMVYRVQDYEGRGPWRPGVSGLWIQDDAPVGRLEETIFDLMPAADLQRLPRDRYYGCGCRRLDDLMLWFTPLERQRLARLGYTPVQLHADAVLASSVWQVLFSRYRPLSHGATRRSWL